MSKSRLIAEYWQSHCNFTVSHKHNNYNQLYTSTDFSDANKMMGNKNTDMFYGYTDVWSKDGWSTNG